MEICPLVNALLHEYRKADRFQLTFSRIADTPKTEIMRATMRKRLESYSGFGNLRGNLCSKYAEWYEHSSGQNIHDDTQFIELHRKMDLVGQLQKQRIWEHHNTHKLMADNNTYHQCVISGFCHGVNVAPTLLRCYAAFINTVTSQRSRDLIYQFCITLTKEVMQ